MNTSGDDPFKVTPSTADWRLVTVNGASASLIIDPVGSRKLWQAKCRTPNSP